MHIYYNVILHSLFYMLQPVKTHHHEGSCKYTHHIYIYIYTYIHIYIHMYIYDKQHYCSLYVHKNKKENFGLVNKELKIIANSRWR